MTETATLLARLLATRISTGEVPSVPAKLTLRYLFLLCALFSTLATGFTASAEEGTKPATHVVARGETLSRIATRYGVALAELVAANTIANPDLIYAGQVLTIPASDSTQPRLAGPDDDASAVISPPAPRPSSFETYVVQRGDNLSRIATRLGVSLQALIAANDIPDPNVIHPGLRLVVPEAGSAQPQPNPGPPVPTVTEGKQVIVVLSQQKVYAFENGSLVGTFLVSTGLPQWPTPQGEFAIYRKVEKQRMRGADYDLPNVQWVSYFYRAYSLHGTYWHDNFGHPMSHGCVNMRNEDAEWLYEWAPVGTSVLVIE